jgi:uncharacterized protein (TIGR02757 family)
LTRAELKIYLDEAYDRFANPEFISDDPISLPHRFTKKQDIEIIGFWVAMLAWGQRVTIINKGEALINLMGGSPHDFVLNYKAKDLKPFLEFKHRTFNSTDTLYFLDFFQRYYRSNKSLETAFSKFIKETDEDVGAGLIGFHDLFTDSPDFPSRTRKHIATPQRKSSCKRLNMFLRWMVRNDGRGVDFGLWEKIKPAQLLCPLDVHVDRLARRYKLIKRKQTDWLTVQELTASLRKFDPVDPVKYDFALFGLGIEGKSLK